MQVDKRKSNILVSLAGGLGNQLFQLAAGIAVSNGRTVQLEGDIAYPRRNYLDQPEIQSFELPSDITVRPRMDPSWLINKTINLFLRMSASSINFEKIPGYRLLKLIGTVLTSLFFREFRELQASTELGDSDIKSRNHNSYLVGLFQSARWVQSPEVEKVMKSLRVIEPSDELSVLKRASLKEMPLVVHVRLGDYLAEVDFGIPSTEYYKEAITIALASEKYKSIWLFSNDLQGAKEHIPKDLAVPIRLVGDIGKSSAESLEAMRFGVGYVIANSTFSWWGAFLSYSDYASVYYPDPWFKSTHAPRNLFPKHWIPIRAWR